ncbi:atrial natriuretic peptide receptor 1-like [Paramacrobiotus metropolitanus]|uniref:atrial natriuretic peptide receptor 1-like n=1 Tax=Paramacrobiotus metropolitanus TaxID=2943436 RepID=UPI0024460396|nr:atrial natriuretic peptide receptor 1-like [Paramacrobiotus metropolitanus]
MLFIVIRLIFFGVCGVQGIIKNVALVSVHVGNNPIYGYFLARPAYEVAVRHIKKQYPLSLGNMQYFPVVKEGYDLCAEGGDHVPEAFLDFYYNRSDIFKSDDVYPVLASPECSLQAIQLADLAREYDLPYFTSVAGDLRLTNKTRYSTTAATASLAGPDVGAAIAALLELYSWRTITLICDTLSLHVGLANFFVVQCGDAKKLMDREKYPGYVREIDSSIGQDYTELLQSFKDRSRVFIFLTMPVYIRRLMITAHLLNMTSGGFVFITLQPTERPGIQAVNWNQKGDEKNNAIASVAYRNLIVLSGMNPNWTEIKNLTDEIAEEGKRQYNTTTLPGDEKNEQITSVYESTMMFAQIFNESYPEVFTMRKSDFIKTYFNREFNFAGRTYATDENGGMVNYIVVSRLNPNTTNLEVAMIYNATSRSFVNIVPELWYWVNRDDPPPDKPLCGFRENECDVSHIGSAIKTGVSVAAAFIALVTFASFAYCWTKRRQELYDPWWILDPEKFSFAPRYQDTTDNFTKKLADLKLGVVARYTTRHVYALNISKTPEMDIIQHIANKKQLLITLYQLRGVSHYNIARFGGIVRYTADYFLISEYGSKATLRQFIEKEHIVIDKDLKSSLMWDILEGLDYLHQSSAGLHGNLNSLSCILDARYCLKIAQAKYCKFFDLLNISRSLEVDCVELLWKSPELLPHKTTKGEKHKKIHLATKESDIYSLAVIFCEVYTRSLPHGATLDSINSIHEAVNKIIDNHGYRIPAIPEKVMPEKLQYLLRLCLGIPSKRPTIRIFRKHFRSVLRRPTTYLVHIMKRLEKQAEDLEHLVVERNRELEGEMHKADLLLQEMLPLSIVRRLRNKLPIAPELFESATIMFCDIPLFQDIVVTSSPLEIIIFLNMVYSHFDHLIEAFDVYKVETINDSYVIASGLPMRNGIEHAYEISKLALSLVKAVRRLPNAGLAERSVQLRVGINSGPVVAGVIGKRMPRYCLFGDTMNTASRMESNGQEGRIHISMATKEMVESSFYTEARGSVNIKGKGIMKTFWLIENYEKAFAL